MGYLNELLALAAMLPKGGVFHAVVQHNNGCPALTGGECNCSPDVATLLLVANSFATAIRYCRTCYPTALTQHSRYLSTTIPAVSFSHLRAVWPVTVKPN